jgi:hypothetical protein
VCRYGRDERGEAAEGVGGAEGFDGVRLRRRDGCTGGRGPAAEGAGWGWGRGREMQGGAGAVEIYLCAGG